MQEIEAMQFEESKPDEGPVVSSMEVAPYTLPTTGSEVSVGGRTLAEQDELMMPSTLVTGVGG